MPPMSSSSFSSIVASDGIINKTVKGCFSGRQIHAAKIRQSVHLNISLDNGKIILVAIFKKKKK